MEPNATHTVGTGDALPITRPHLPEPEIFAGVIRELFSTRLLSNFGKYCRLFEERAAGVLDHPTPLAVVSCDIGLVLTWKALGCTAGEVITPSFTFCSTVNALRWNGLTPVFADINPRTCCIDVTHVRRLISPRTVAICAVHVYGCPAAVADLEDLARAHGLKLVFDAAHGLGASYRGRGMGAYGDAAVFSLSGTKIITAGEGGLATFRDPAVAERFRRLRAYGFVGDYNCREVGLNGKMAEINAALGWLSLELLPDLLRHRATQIACYHQELAACPEVSFQVTPPDCTNGYKDFAVFFRTGQQRAVAEKALTESGVQTKRYFLPCHRMTAHTFLVREPLPVTDDVYERVLCLPLFHDLSVEQIRRVCRIVVAALKSADGRSASAA